MHSHIPVNGITQFIYAGLKGFQVNAVYGCVWMCMRQVRVRYDVSYRECAYCTRPLRGLRAIIQRRDMGVMVVKQTEAEMEKDYTRCGRQRGGSIRAKRKK